MTLLSSWSLNDNTIYLYIFFQHFIKIYTIVYYCPLFGTLILKYFSYYTLFERKKTFLQACLHRSLSEAIYFHNCEQEQYVDFNYDNIYCELKFICLANPLMHGHWQATSRVRKLALCFLMWHAHLATDWWTLPEIFHWEEWMWICMQAISIRPTVLIEVRHRTLEWTV